MSTSIEAIDDRIHNAGGAVYDVQRWMELVVVDLPRGDMGPGPHPSPACVDGIHV